MCILSRCLRIERTLLHFQNLNEKSTHNSNNILIHSTRQQSATTAHFVHHLQYRCDEYNGIVPLTVVLVNTVRTDNVVSCILPRDAYFGKFALLL
jgi:hypothetical protein